jgi:hypothetical protein
MSRQAQEPAGVSPLLRRLAAYLENMFSFREHAQALRDARPRPQIPTAGVWLTAFALCVVRFRSFNALEQQLRRPGVWEAWVGPRKPSADSLGRVLSQLNLDDLRQFLLHVHRRMWRAKAIQRRYANHLRVVAVDGHELWSSYARCCPDCHSREVKTSCGVVTQFYHRVVTACWLDVTLPVVIDMEPIRPGEGEVVAARRLVQRLLANYGRLIDVFAGDALYLEAPFCKELLNAGKHFVVVMKQEARDLYQDADRLRQLTAPTVVAGEHASSQTWDLPDLTTFTTLGTRVRVVWVEEHRRKVKIVAGRPHVEIEHSTWVWVTSLPQPLASAAAIARWGHHRWDIENRAFNELSNLWSMDHCFVHNTTASLALLLTMAMALATTALFFERNIKAAARHHLTRSSLVIRFLEDMVACHGVSVWARARPPG